MIKVGDMVITKPELNLKDGAILTPVEVISVANSFVEIKDKRFYSQDVLKKVNKYNFSLSRNEILPDLQLDCKDFAIRFTTNYDEWDDLKEQPDKLFVTVGSSKHRCWASFTLNQINQVCEYFNKFNDVMQHLQHENFKKKMTLQQIQKQLGYEIELVDEEEI